MTAPPCFTAANLARVTTIRHGFFGRAGGVSIGIYASLNAGPGSNDNPTHVAENRARIAGAMGIDADNLLSLYQVHSTIALRVGGPWAGPRPQADALVTTTRGLALTALSADCAPVLFVDEHAGVIGAAHAGWKGAVSGVLEACIATMVEAGAQPSRIVAAIGPCIHQPSYEVGPEFRDAVLKADADGARFFIAGAGDRLHFDLPGYCLARLSRAGVSAAATPHDTCPAADALFSHRRTVHNGGGDYGRNCAAIALA